MIKKKIKLGKSERSYKLVAFTLNVLESTSVKLIRMEERRRVPSYVQAKMSLNKIMVSSLSRLANV